MVISTPLYNKLREYIASNPLCFHTPGHKMGKGIPQNYLKDLAMLDITEIHGTDNLQYPSGVIKEAQERAAGAFGAEHTFFLVNGSTVGIISMIAAVCKPGDKLIVSRDCHKSVINAMMLAGVRPVYVSTDYDNIFGIPTALRVKDLREVIKKNADAVGVFITRPNYYGICADIGAIKEIIVKYNMLLIVDEAHGAHLSFNSKLPISAMQAGADICVQSAHKTLPAFTQSAYLHVKSNKIDIERLKFYLNMFQTTSPSYILMAFLDIAREIMEYQGKTLIEELLDNIKELSDNLMRNNIIFFDETRLCEGSFDKTRIVINCSSMGFTGYAAHAVLRDRYNIQVEMADYNNIVCISTVADNKMDLLILAEALKDIKLRNGIKEKIIPVGLNYVKLPVDVPAVSLNELMSKKIKKISLKQSAGQVSSSIVTPYPPGIPFILPGEIITQEVVENLLNIISAGGVVNGLSDSMEVKVLER